MIIPNIWKNKTCSKAPTRQSEKSDPCQSCHNSSALLVVWKNISCCGEFGGTPRPPRCLWSTVSTTTSDLDFFRFHRQNRGPIWSFLRWCFFPSISCLIIFKIDFSSCPLCREGIYYSYLSIFGSDSLVNVGWLLYTSSTWNFNKCITCPPILMILHSPGIKFTIGISGHLRRNHRNFRIAFFSSVRC